MIARTEEARATMAGTEEAWRQSGIVEGKRWLAATDACEFCLAIAQEVNEMTNSADLGGTFAVQGQAIAGIDGGTMQMSYGDVQSPPLHPHCRCDMEAILIGERG